VADLQVEEARTISWVHPSELTEAVENPREISPDRYAALKHSLSHDPEMMKARPIIVDSRRGDVVCGNMRLRACKELGWEKVPVFLKEFESDAQRREWMLRDNQEYGNWVPDELAALVSMHESEGGDVKLLGFADQELRDLMSLNEPDLPDDGDANNEPVPEVWAIVIDLDSEEEQQTLLEEFAERNLKCRALMV
jgi:ParB-like chromosome segregation protein Spo0J